MIQLDHSGTPGPSDVTTGSVGPKSHRIKVLWVIKALGPGGAEMLLLDAAQQHDHSHFELHAVCQVIEDPDFADRLCARGVDLHCLGGRQRALLPFTLRLPRLLRSIRPDLIHVHSPLAGSITRLFAAVLLHRTPVVSTEHNTWQSYRLPTRVATAITAQRDRRIWAISSESLESIRGPVRKRATKLLHGIDIAAIQHQFQTGIARRSERTVRQGDPLRLINIANLRDQKDHVNLLHALALVHASGHHVHCSIVGSGPLGEQLEQLRKELGLEQVVTFLGRRSDALDLLDQSDIFVLSSAWEGMPLAVMEALALGVPIVSTAVGGVREELASSEACILCEPRNPRALADAIVRAVEDPALRTRMTRQCLAESIRFDSQRAVRQIEVEYIALVNR